VIKLSTIFISHYPTIFIFNAYRIPNTEPIPAKYTNDCISFHRKTNTDVTNPYPQSIRSSSPYIGSNSDFPDFIYGAYPDGIKSASNEKLDFLKKLRNSVLLMTPTKVKVLRI